MRSLNLDDLPHEDCLLPLIFGLCLSEVEGMANPLNVTLISTYELGHQPFGLASPAAWLRKAGANVTCLDLAVQRIPEESIAAADLIAFYLPMHTATKIATTLVPKIRRINRKAHLCFYGLYAPMNESFLRKLGADTILGGEFEEGLSTLYENLSERSSNATKRDPPLISLTRQKFLVPDRTGLQPLSTYAYLNSTDGSHRTAGYTEASRGCKHLCRHCPVVPVYRGIFRTVQPEIVLADVKSQVENGARHITFGDPDFFNGIGHAIPLVKALHTIFPDLSYDVTIKIEHLLKHQQHLATLRDTGCIFVTSAVEALDNTILNALQKGHTREDFLMVVDLFRDVGLTLLPTFVAFSPWTSLEGYIDLLRQLDDLEMIDYVAPIQLAIRLLIPAGSRLLELPFIQDRVAAFDEAALFYPWRHQDPRVDTLSELVLEAVKQGEARKETRRAIFARVWSLAQEAYGVGNYEAFTPKAVRPVIPVAHMSEAWFCCAEPTEGHIVPEFI